MDERVNIILRVLGLLTVVTAMYSLFRTKNVSGYDGGDARGIPPSRGDLYPIRIWTIFLGAFVITLIVYIIYKYI